MVGSESLVSNEEDATICTGSYVSGSGWSLSLASDSGSTTWGYMSLISGREWSDKYGSVIISSGICSSLASGSVTVSSANAGSSDVSESLILNSEDSANGDSGDILMRIDVSSSGTG